ncbi:peptidase [Allosphingosinicella indica]|uniref:Putative proteasome-type protease n=1 Tax=Allosphingosinicella indica TaxID=941907 RepID=A0A1X7G507_9SPHN|nr:peptidase [Allosphingosinicella indica]SMF64089.1 putative proteasome-type protease [Allosphingosinicella indica]
MTYCLGMLLDAGLVLMADTRTNAGIDNFSSFKKLHVLADDRDRQIFACSAGSLSISQSVIGLIHEGLPTGDGEMTRTLKRATSMFRVAQLVGEAVQIASQTVGAALATINASSSVSLLLGGRVGKAPPALYLIYNAGNFIECKADVPFLQIGETKYGKPILDRGLDYETPLHEAVKVGFLSFDSAMRSNLGVARPIDLLVMPSDARQGVFQRRIEPDDEYFNDLSMRWAAYLHEATGAIPNPPWLPDAIVDE